MGCGVPASQLPPVRLSCTEHPPRHTWLFPHWGVLQTKPGPKVSCRVWPTPPCHFQAAFPRSALSVLRGWPGLRVSARQGGAKGGLLLSWSPAVVGPVGQCVVRSRCALAIGKPLPWPGKANLQAQDTPALPRVQGPSGLALVNFSPSKAVAWSPSLELGGVGSSYARVQGAPRCWLHHQGSWGGHSALACLSVTLPPGSWVVVV